MSKKRNKKVMLQKEFKIMIASDNHLGYKEKDHNRQSDSFAGFEEVLQHARTQSVDLVLLGGDLFDTINPTPKSMHEAYQIFNRNIFGNPSLKDDFTLQL
jgi:double-strand break repair protein MRE11